MTKFTLVRILLIAGILSGLFGQSALWAMPAALDAPAAITLPIPLTNIVQVSAGGEHNCALTTTGGVKCWGLNGDGQLGDGTVADRWLPVDVSGLSSGIKAVSAGRNFTCVLTTAGGVKCWGYNGEGMLGDGTTTSRSTPVDVVGLSSGVSAISAGGKHVCAVMLDGQVKCWGANAVGALGNGTNIMRSTPGDTLPLPVAATAISAGRGHTCIVTVITSVMCWGYNSDGQVGDNSITDRFAPVLAEGLTHNLVALATGGVHSCALTLVGGLYCWGDNEGGQIGDGTNADRWVRTLVTGLQSNIVAVANGGGHSCALTSSGAVKCWGYNNRGQLGDGSTQDRLTWVDVTGLSAGITALAAGTLHTCAVTTSGGVKCWGDNEFGQLGDGTTLNHNYAADVNTVATCFKLSLSHSGNGADPAATPTHSQGCPLSHYLPSEAIAVVSAPADGQYIQSWQGTRSDESRDPANLVLAPAADHTVSVTYDVCRTLTTKHTGAGANPVAVPSQSVGCALGKYAAGDILTLVAEPAAQQRVQSWTGATQAPADGIPVNTLTMPDADKPVSVAYEPCFALATSIQGEGELLQANPTATTGCAAGAYIAGQTVTLLAAPAAGWRIAGWDGVANNDSTDPLNSLVMAKADATVAVVYELADVHTSPSQAQSLFLPSVTR